MQAVAAAALMFVLGASPATAGELRVSVDPTRDTQVIPTSFQGFSMEYGSVLSFTGAEPYGPNLGFDGLVRNLGAFGNGPLSLRIGGGSTDSAWWNPNAQKKPEGLQINLSPYFTDSLSRFVNATGVTMILGLNLAYPDHQVPITWATEALKRLPARSIASFELGNEPNIYYKRPAGKNPDGTIRYTRDRDWGVPGYVREANQLADELRAAGVSTPLMGPSALPEWISFGPNLIEGLKAKVPALSYHSYALTRCGLTPSSPTYPTVKRLLSDQVLLSTARNWANLAAKAGAAGLPLRLTEGNTVSCGGVEGVSDVFAAALWGADWPFLMAAAGVQGVNYHISSPTYAAAFPGSDPEGKRIGAYVGPLYFGMLFFAEATANRARLIPNATFSAKPVGGGRLIRPWATVDPNGVVRVALINRSANHGGRVRLTVKGAHGRASLVRLYAPKLTSKKDITLGGQSFAQPSFDGKLQGTRRVGHRPVGRGGRLTVKMRPHEALLLTMRTR